MLRPFGSREMGMGKYKQKHNGSCFLLEGGNEGEIVRPATQFENDGSFYLGFFLILFLGGVP